MSGGTEAFPDLGKHCQYEDCRQLDFLPFTCNCCLKVFCLEHRTHKSHACAKENHISRRVAICDICASSIEKQENEEEKDSISRHLKSGTCDPSKMVKKPRCPVIRCKEILTFSNKTTCKICSLNICLKHRFPSDHSCRITKLNCRDMKNGLKFSQSIKVF